MVALGGMTVIALSATLGPTVSAAATSSSQVGGSNPYRTVFFDDFATTDNVVAYESPLAANDHLTAQDNTNIPLQKPTVAADVSLVAEGSDTSDGNALQVATQVGTYQTTLGPVEGITNGRADIGPNFSLANHTVSIRLRTVGAAGKSAAMIWPKTGWPWESDLAETFPGVSAATAHHHKALKPGQAVKDQLVATTSVDPTEWHTYTVTFLGGPKKITGVQYLVDGVPLTFLEAGKPVTTITGRWVPKTGMGHVAIGKALPAARGTVPLDYFDAVQVDWVQIQAR
jgi:hypothetical protein